MLGLSKYGTFRCTYINYEWADPCCTVDCCSGFLGVDSCRINAELIVVTKHYVDSQLSVLSTSS